MAGSWRIVLSVAASLVVVSTVSAFNGRFGLWRAPSSVSYYVVPYYLCCPPAPTVVPVPNAKPGTRYAPATPAPPSATVEPPLQKMVDKKTANDAKMPVIVASHSPASGTARPALAKDRCRVGFWNLSGRDVTVTIDGKAWQLPKDRAVTLETDRQFTWQVQGRPQHVDRVAEGQMTHEVVITE